MMDYTEMFSKLWDLVIGLIQTIDKVWNWLNTSHKLGFNIPVLGIFSNITINPLALTGTAMLTLIVAMFIKQFIPMA